MYGSAEMELKQMSVSGESGAQNEQIKFSNLEILLYIPLLSTILSIHKYLKLQTYSIPAPTIANMQTTRSFTGIKATPTRVS